MLRAGEFVVAPRLERLLAHHPGVFVFEGTPFSLPFGVGKWGVVKKKIERGAALKELVYILGAELLNAQMEGCQLRTSLDDLI